MRSLNKKILRVGLPIIGVATFATIITCVSGVLVSMPIVSMGGSTAVLPLINSLANVYNDIDIVTSAGGSGAGINAIVDGTKEIGMASKNPGIDLSEVAVKKDKKSKAWKDKNIKTLTIAWDGIGIIYKSKDNISIDINENNIAKIYHAFSGLKTYTLGEIANNENKTKITPFARNGGSNVSGTADAFLNDSHLKINWNDIDEKEVKDILKNGAYRSNVIQTAEANSQAWNRVKDGPEGSMIYLSAGFILNNLSEIEKKGFKVATYNGIKMKDDQGQIKITEGYDWYRPFNLIYSINQIKNNKKIKNMLTWIFDGIENNTNDDDVDATWIIRKEGYIPLKKEQLEMMINTKEGASLKDGWMVDPLNADIRLGYCGAGEAPKS